MTLYELAEVMDAELVCRRYPKQNGRWMAELEYAEVKGDGVLISAYGNGDTPQAAMSDYLKHIRGQVLVRYATSKRTEFHVPNDLIL